VTGGALKILCFDGAGQKIWEAAHGPAFGEGNAPHSPYPGARATPTVDGDMVYLLGALGRLTAYRLRDGKPVWTADVVAELGGRVPPWGYSESVLIDGEKLLFTPGGERTGTFAALDLDGFWSTQVVDHVSLARRLRERGARVVAVPDATMSTPPGSGGLREWAGWLTRQLFFLRVVFPLSWAVGGLLGWSMALLLAAAVGLAVAAASVPAAAALVAFTALAVALRRVHPEPGPAARWAAAGWVALAVACVCHARSGLARRLVWRGIAYGVAADGSARVLRRSDRSSSTRVPS